MITRRRVLQGIGAVLGLGGSVGSAEAYSVPMPPGVVIYTWADLDKPSEFLMRSWNHFARATGYRPVGPVEMYASGTLFDAYQQTITPMTRKTTSTGQAHPSPMFYYKSARIFRAAPDPAMPGSWYVGIRKQER